MKIILVNSLANGGGERIASNIANELIRHEEIIVVTLENNNKYYVDDRVRVINLNQRKWFPYIYHTFELKKIIKTENIDFIQSHLYRSNFINILCKLFGGNHYVQVVNHGDPFQYKKNGLKGFIMLNLMKLLYPMADQIIAISDVMNVNIRKLMSRNKNKVITVNNPNNISEIIKNSNSECDSNIELNFNYIVYMGRLIKSKNIDLLIHAIKCLDITLVIIGSGPEELNLKKLAETLKVSNRVIFLGQLSNPFPVIKNALALVSASSSEGFPNSIIESLACSTPVIHSDCISGPREILQPSSTVNKTIQKNNYEITPFGILYNTGDVTALIQSIKYISTLPKEEKSELSHNCKKRAYDFDSSVIVKKYFR